MWTKVNLFTPGLPFTYQSLKCIHSFCARAHKSIWIQFAARCHWLILTGTLMGKVTSFFKLRPRSYLTWLQRAHGEAAVFNTDPFPFPLSLQNGGAAASYNVAEQYVSAFSNLAKESNTILLPSNTGDISSMVTQVKQHLHTHPPIVFDVILWMDPLLSSDSYPYWSPPTVSQSGKKRLHNCYIEVFPKQVWFLNPNGPD